MNEEIKYKNIASNMNNFIIQVLLNNWIIYIYKRIFVQKLRYPSGFKNKKNFMQRKHKEGVQKQKQDESIDLSPQVRTLLSFEYLTHFPQKLQSFDEMVRIAVHGLQDNILKLKYQLTSEHIYRYGIKNFHIKENPFPQHQVQLIQQISSICETIIRKRDYAITTQSLNKLNFLLHRQCHHMSLRDQNQSEMQRIGSLPSNKLKAKQERAFHEKQLQTFKSQESNLQFPKMTLKVHLTQKFKQFNLNFKYLNIKEAIVYEALSRCQIWFTICRQRKKSGKGFHLDPLINTFDSILRKAQIPQNSAFHISVLPRKNVRKIEMKKNIQKTKNPLYDAVAAKNYQEVKNLILSGANLQSPAFGDERMGRQLRCAHKAAQNNDLQMCKILTSFGVNWQSLDSELMTPVFSAVHGRSMQVMKYLVEEIKVNIQHKEIQDRTPFYWACTQGELDFIKYLYSKGADINSKSKLGRCPLSKACFLGRIDIIQFLMGCPEIDILSKDQKGRTALHNATFGPKGGREGHKFGTNASDSPDSAQLLLEKGFPVDEVDFEKNTSLHIAASSEAINSIPLLMAFGASLMARNDYGETPIMTAAKFGHLETVKMLYERYRSPITEKDIFGKNILMLVAKFRQFKQNTFKNFPAQGSLEQKNNFRKQNTSINPVYAYIIDKLIFQCYTKYLGPDYQWIQEKNDKLAELHQSFFEMLKHGVHEEFMLLIQKIIEYKVPFPQLKLKDVKLLLQMEQFFQGQSQKNVVTQIFQSKNPQGYHVFQLEKQAITQFITWLIQKNSLSLLEFAAQNQILVFYHFNQKNHKQQKQAFYELPMAFLVNSISILKEKVITFCLLNLNFNWIDYIDENTGGNLLHLLVKNRKVGCLIQITKLLGGKKLNFARNKFVVELMDKEEVAEQHHTQDFDFRESPINQLFITMLAHQDNDGITPYKLAHIIKQTSIIKILSERLKQNSIIKGPDILEKLDVKEFKIQRQLQDQEQIKIFELGHEKDKQLQTFIQQIELCQTREQLSKFMKILASDPKDICQKVSIETDIQKQWNCFKSRPLHFIKSQNDIHLLKPILNFCKVIGIDVQYDFADGNQTIICIIQFSTLEQDYIVDMMTCTFQNGQNRYIHFIQKLKYQFFAPLCYDHTITKLMHGSDHDLYILKSCFNCSFVNFLDSSRIDVDIRRIKDGLNKKIDQVPQNDKSKINKINQNVETKVRARCVRGLATLAKDYLNIGMSKDHQISQWKIRPLPASMIDYARRDSMIMPFLVHRQLKCFDRIEDLKDSIINGLRLSKKNKKANQPLIKSIIPI